MSTTITSNTRAVSVVLKDVTFDHARFGQAYLPTFAQGGDAPQWSTMVRVAEGSESYPLMLDLKEAGLMVNREDETGDLTLNLKQYANTKTGKENKITVLDSDFNELDIETRATIGNGSKGNVAFYYYGYANANGVGFTARMTDIQVTEKVEFTPETTEERAKRLFG